MAQRDRKTAGLARQAPHAVPKSGYGFLGAVLDRFSDGTGELAAELDAPHQTGGNPGYPARGMLRVNLLKFLLSERYANRFLDRLGNDPRLLELCELHRAPSERAFSDFKNHKLAPHQEELDRVLAAIFKECDDQIEALKELGVIPEDAPLLGEYLAVDATDIIAHACPRGEHCEPSKEDCTKKHRHCDAPVPEQCTRPHHKPCPDPDAAWGYRTPKGKSPKPSRSKKVIDIDGSKELFFGYGADVIVDAYYGLPLYIDVRPANPNEGPKFRADMDATFKLHPWLRPRAQYLTADAGYAALYNFDYLAGDHLEEEIKINPVIAIPRPPKDDKGRRLFDSTYDAKGRPVCVGGRAMEFVETDKDGAHWFRCSPEGCHLKNRMDWSRYCDYEHSERPEGKLLRIMGTVHRASEEWDGIYRMRPVIERYFSSDKQTRLLDKHQALGRQRVSLHARMATLSHLLTSWGRLMADDYDRMRRMTIKLPRATRAAGLGGTQECAQCRLCSHHDPEGSAE